MEAVRGVAAAVVGRHRLRESIAGQQGLRSIVMRWRARTLNHRDVYVASYPKSGSTWLRMLLARTLGAEPDMRTIPDLVPPLGWHDGASVLTTTSGGRLVKVHETAAVLQQTPPRRAIVIIRDGRDVAVSYYHHQRRQTHDGDSFPDFLDRFLAGDVGSYGPWPAHVSGWLRWPGDLLVVRYEDLLGQGPTELQRIARFVGVGLDAQRTGEIYDACLPERMREGETEGATRAASGKRVPPTAGFVRRAAAGQWKETFDDASRSRFDERAGHVLRVMGYE